MIPNMAQAFFEECDPDLAKQSMPAQLKLMEGLLKNGGETKEILTALCMGYAGYAMFFVEEEDPERAARLYLRAKAYGFRALGDRAAPLRDPHAAEEALQAALQGMAARDLEPLLWVTVSWNAWIHLNLDKPAALAQFRAAEACLGRVMELDPGFFQGTPYILQGSILAAKPPMLGGKPDEARAYFEKAMALNQGKFLLAPFYFARYYAVRVQDRALFLELMGVIRDADPDVLKNVCLINAVVKQRAERMREKVDDFFL
jgi:tetratricopeptide (TPR) repeat protein